MTDDALDRRHMRRALTLARRGRYGASPNPMVGCVIARGERVLAEGWHRQVGGPHAEAHALARRDGSVRGATAYVTLEPCNHTGRTPPCSAALVEAGVARVVISHRDPNPVAEGGAARLRDAGIAVSCGLLGRRAARLNWSFLTGIALGRPGVTLKWAASLDGKIATASGHSQWISSPPARRWALEEREAHDALLVGSGTALADDPRLDRRLGHAGRPNVRVVLDRRLRLPPSSRMLGLPGTVLVYADPAPDRRRRRALEAVGATVVAPPRAGLEAVLQDLFERGVRSVLVEGGGEVASAFVTARCFDRVATVVAPMLIGGAAATGPLGGDGADRLDDAPRLDGLRVGRRGNDLLISGFRHGCLPALYASVGV